MKEDAEKHTCGLELTAGLNGIDYPQKFVRAARPNAPGPCNYTAERAPSHEEVMSMLK